MESIFDEKFKKQLKTLELEKTEQIVNNIKQLKEKIEQYGRELTMTLTQ